MAARRSGVGVEDVFFFERKCKPGIFLWNLHCQTGSWVSKIRGDLTLQDLGQHCGVDEGSDRKRKLREMGRIFVLRASSHSSQSSKPTSPFERCLVYSENILTEPKLFYCCT